jgi:hypothetical protein
MELRTLILQKLAQDDAQQRMTPYQLYSHFGTRTTLGRMNAEISAMERDHVIIGEDVTTAGSSASYTRRYYSITSEGRIDLEARVAKKNGHVLH